MNKNMLIAKGFVEKSDKEEDGVLDVSVASANVVDRDGEIINQDGWDLRNFKKNPQLLWAHNIREVKPPLGKVSKIWFEGEGRAKVMKFKALFDMEDTFAADIFRKIKKGFLNAFSVGFMPLEKDGITYTKAELLEISVVPVPSNPAALVEIRSKGIEPMEWKDFTEQENEQDTTQKPEENATETVVDPVEPIQEPVSESTEEVTEEKPEDTKPDDIKSEDVKTLLREVMLEMKKEKEDKELANLRDALRMVYQAVGIALKNIKDMKGGENK